MSMASVLENVNKYVGLKEQRLIFYVGLYLIVGLFIHAYLFEIFLFFILLVLTRYAHNFISEYTKQTIDPAGKYVFITGCDSGFGLASAKAMRDLGFRVIAGCYDENSPGVQELKSRSWVDKIEIVSLDVASEISVEVAAKEVKDICSDQGLWAVINNAGINCMGASELVSMVMYHRVAEVNLYGAIRVTKALLPMLRQSKGRVVNVTSERGFNPWKNNSSYCVTKFGLEAYSACLKREMADFGVKVVTVAPGHFGGATAIADSKLNDIIKERMLLEHSKLSLDDQRNAYPKEGIEEFCNFLYNISDDPISSKTPGPVVDAYIDAVSNLSPKSCYHVHGHGKFGVDYVVTMSQIRPFIPLPLVPFVENILMKIFG